jgi:hypothetical protein
MKRKNFLTNTPNFSKNNIPNQFSRKKRFSQPRYQESYGIRNQGFLDKAESHPLRLHNEK